MKRCHRASCSMSVAALLALAASAGCNGSANLPEPFSREELIEETATVAAVDSATRAVELRDKAGETTTVYAGPQVRNFDQIKVGDQVDVTYHAAVAAELTALDQPQSGNEQVTMEHRAEPGQQPYGQLAASVTTTVQIDRVDPEGHTVSFHRDDGYVRTVTLQNEKAREFARKLKPGDVIKVKYSEAIAVAVRPATAVASDDG